MLPVFLIGAFAYTVVAALSWAYRGQRPRAAWFDVGMAAALSAWIAVVALSGIEHLVPGALAVTFLGLAHWVLAYLSRRGANGAGAEPILLVYRGEFSGGALGAAGLTRERLLAHLHERGIDPSSPSSVLVLAPSGELQLYRIGSDAALGFPPSRPGEASSRN